MLEKCVLLVVLLLTGTVMAEQATIAVAANFAAPMKSIVTAYEQTSGHRVVVVVGSSGMLYAQIKHGAPFHAFLSADTLKPESLIQDDLAAAESLFTYTQGTLVLWSATMGLVDQNGKVLEQGGFSHLALANPKLAPYGLAAVQVLEALGLYDAVRPKLVQGENIAQTFQFVRTGNAELGFVSLAQIQSTERLPLGSFWVVPPSLYRPIQQAAVLLQKGEKNQAAINFLQFLRSQKAIKIMQLYGYQQG